MKKILSHIKDAITHRHVRTVAKGAVKAAVVTAHKAQEVGSDALDVLMRKNTDDQVREHILLQNRYNDLLALKLDEALTRITHLEERLKGGRE